MQLEQEELEIDLKELFFELLSHWKILTVSTIMAAAIALVASKFILVPQYESTSALYVLSNSITSLADIQIGSSLTNDYIVVVKGRPILDQVIENLNLDETYDSLEDRITLENPADSRILEITVRDTDPNRAKVIADEMASLRLHFDQDGSVCADHHSERLRGRRACQPSCRNEYIDRRNRRFSPCGGDHYDILPSG